MGITNATEYSQRLNTTEQNDIVELDNNAIHKIFVDKFFDDLDDGKIKRTFGNDGKVYFEMPNGGESSINKFSITNEQWENILSNRNAKDLEQLNNNVQTSNKINVVTADSQAKQEELKNDIQNSNNVTSNNPSNTTKQESVAISGNDSTGTEVHEIQGNDIEIHVDELLDWFEDFSKKRPISKKHGESHNTKKRLKEVIKNDIAYLKSIKRELKRYTYTSNPDIFEENLDRLESHKQPLMRAREIITGGGNTSELPTILASLKDVKRADKFETKMNSENSEMNKLLKNVTLKRLWNKDMEGFKNYLNDVWSGEIEHPTEHPFYVQHQADFAYINSINPTLYSSITTPKKQKVNEQYVNTNNNVQIITGTPAGNCEKRGGSVLDKGGRILSDLLVKIGIINENDTKKREARSKFGGVALLGLGGRAIYNIFTNKGGKRWAWVGGTLASVVAISNKDKIGQWFKDAFGSENPTPNEVLTQANQNAGVQNPTGPEAQEVIDTLVLPTTTVIKAVGDIDINTLISGGIIKENDGNFEFDYLKHKEYIENNVTDPSEKICKLQANEELRKDPSLIQSGLKNLGITNVDILKAVGDKDGTLIKSNVIDNYINGIGSPINAEISKQGFKAADNESRHKIIAEHDYGKQPITDADIIRYITNGLIVLKDSSLTPFINSKLINRGQKCMIGCEKVTFSTYEELLKSVRLTEWIMNHFKGRTNARNDEPFHLGVQNIGGNIQFNDGVFIDTDILRANIFHNTLEEISPNLNKNKRMYVDYLNKLWKSSLI